MSNSIISNPLLGQELPPDFEEVLNTKADKTTRIDAGYGLDGGGDLGDNVEITLGLIVVDDDIAATIGYNHHIVGDNTLTLPDGFLVGQTIRVTKNFDTSPIIAGKILTKNGQEHFVEYDIDEEIIFRWNGANWEI